MAGSECAFRQFEHFPDAIVAARHSPVKQIPENKRRYFALDRLEQSVIEPRRCRPVPVCRSGSRGDAAVPGSWRNLGMRRFTCGRWVLLALVGLMITPGASWAQVQNVEQAPPFPMIPWPIGKPHMEEGGF